MRTILSGELGALSLFDLCQFLMLNRRTGELVVERGGKRAFLFFDEGQILNAIDDGLNDGAPAALRILLVTEGTFEFREGPVTPSRRIEVSTENLLLDVARQVDELAEQSGLRRTAPGQISVELSQAALFQLKQRQAQELEDLFRSVAGGEDAAIGGGTTGRFEDALRAARAMHADVHYREEDGAAVLLARVPARTDGGVGLPDGGAPRPGACVPLPVKAVRGFLKRAFGPAARRRLTRGEAVSGRFEGEGTFFHLRAWLHDGALEVDAIELLAEIPPVNPGAFFDDLVHEISALEAGTILLSMPPRAGVTTVLDAVLASLLASEHGRFLLVEERPRYRLAAPASVLDRWETSEVPGGPSGLTALAARCGPRLVVVDAVRDRRWLRAVLETARAGFAVLAALPGAGTAAAVRTIAGGADEEERRVLLQSIAESARIFFGAVPAEGSAGAAYAHEKIWCSLEAQGLLGSGDLDGFEACCKEPGRADVRPLPLSVSPR